MIVIVVVIVIVIVVVIVIVIVIISMNRHDNTVVVCRDADMCLARHEMCTSLRDNASDRNSCRHTAYSGVLHSVMGTRVQMQSCPCI